MTLVSASKQPRGKAKTERLSCPQIDDGLAFRGLLNQQFADQSVNLGKTAS